MNHDGVGERIALDSVGSSSDGDNLSAVLTNNLILNIGGLIKDRCHLLNELTVSEHELIDQNEVAALYRYSLSLIAALSALARVSAGVSVSTTTSTTTSATASIRVPVIASLSSHTR